MSPLHNFATWEPLLRLLRTSHAESLAAPGGHVAGSIGHGSWSVPVQRRRPRPGQAMLMSDMQEEFDAIKRVQDALTEAGLQDIAFTAEIPPSGQAVLHLFDFGPATAPGIGNALPGALILVENAVPAPWRRLPEAVPGAQPAPSVDVDLLERTLRERLPDAIGATEEEIATAEARLGVALPEEIKVLYRVTRARWEDWGDDYEVAEHVFDVVGFELASLDHLAVADVSNRSFYWGHAALEVAVTPPDDAVQGLVGSPGWIVIGGTGYGDQVAVDLTPGPRGHLGQIIVLDHEQSVGANLFAESLTDLVLQSERSWYSGRRLDQLPYVARVHHQSLKTIEAAAHADLEVLSLGVWDGEPFSLAPVVGLPRLRTLSAYPGTLADPTEIAELTGLEFLELTPEDWRVLLDAGAAPRSLSAAAIQAHSGRDPRPIMALANEILALWDRPPITETVINGDLGALL
ncbi:cell wall assembly regulator SMI1 [Kitasatospora sp. GAS204A]|uniref:SMI1/KNR4 family protein n=1 Tax=unclassified Kitasatospora TaxID=2633591 RepID=UPI0024743D75|nr:SMI1/KNR4 family protein [Kitasatospora sp. GAS204B]MDH6120253.1 cell wall assembly regulator SMI1 [Kitasatospora sp. GAS204B]